MKSTIHTPPNKSHMPSTHGNSAEFSNNECFFTLDEALAVIEKHKEHNTVLCAWVQKQRKNVFKAPVWFENYTNMLGMVDDRFVTKEGNR